MTMQASVKLDGLLGFDLALGESTRTDQLDCRPWAKLETVMTIIYRAVHLPKDPRRSPMTAESPENGIPRSEPGIRKRGRVASSQRTTR